VVETVTARQPIKPDRVRRFGYPILDWVAVWLVVFISVALSTFVIDPTSFEDSDKTLLTFRSGLLASFITVFYASVTWLQRAGSTVPDDVFDKLPHDLPQDIAHGQPETQTEEGQS